MDQNTMKQAAAKAALEYVEKGAIVGVGTGTTANYFIEYLAAKKDEIKGAVASSAATEKALRHFGIAVFELNEIDSLPIYVDGADEINEQLQMIKGGGGALTREKIISHVAKNFICIADETKKVTVLGKFPLPVEVIPMARSYVGREIVKRGGSPVYREGFVTDNGNRLIDIWNLEIVEPIRLEEDLNNIAGIVANGLFALRPADTLLLGTKEGVKIISKNHKVRQL